MRRCACRMKARRAQHATVTAQARTRSGRGSACSPALDRKEPNIIRCRRPPILASVLAFAAFSLLAAGCGSGSPNSVVAHLSTSTSGSSLTSGGGSSSPESSASTQQKTVAYGQCMRTHGVPNFPDSGSGGSKEAVVRALREVSNSQAEAAQTACQRLQPNGGQSNQAELAQHLSDLLAFARCMRTHGIPNFPDPTSSGQVTHEMLGKAGINVHQPVVLQAADACVSVTHGILTKAAVARIAAGH